MNNLFDEGFLLFKSNEEDESIKVDEIRLVYENNIEIMVAVLKQFPKYLIFSDSRVFSGYSNKFLKPSTNNGYLYASIKEEKDSKSRLKSIHYLVANSFCENSNIKENINIDHINRNKLDNNYKNLKFVTPQENSMNRNRNNTNIVIQYTVDGTFIKEFQNALIACEETGLNLDGIRRSCNDITFQRRTIHQQNNTEYKWRYQNKIEKQEIPEGVKIPGYDKYIITDLGVIYSLKLGKTLQLFTTSAGYKSVSITEDKKSKKFFVHRLVMLTFKGASKLPVNHIDGNKSNNNLSNLEYVTYSENSLHAVKLGNIKTRKIKKIDKDTKEVIEVYSSLTEAANYYNTSSSFLGDACRRIKKTAKGFIWRFDEDNEYSESDIEIEDVE